MADIPIFDARAQRRGAPDVDTRTGAAEAWLTLAQGASAMARQLGGMADRASAREGELAGLAAGTNLALPSPDLPADQQAQAAAAATDAGARAMTFFESKGWSRAQAAGIVGNLIQESSLDPKAVRADDAGPGLPSEGLGQWNRDRLARLKSFGGDKWQDFETQLAFVHHELTTTESGAGARLRRAVTVDDATQAVIGYERPQGWTPGNPRGGHGWSKRLANAQALIGETGAVSPSVIGSAAPSLQASPAGGGPPATIQPLVLTRGLSIRDQAYDRAAIGAAADRLDVQAYQALEDIALKFPDQPEEALTAIEAYSASVKGQALPPELGNRFDAIVARHKIGIMRQASEKSETKRKDDREAAFLDNWTTRRTALVRLARRLPDGEMTVVENGKGRQVNPDQEIAAELGEMEALLASAGGDLTPKQRAALKIELAQDVGTARIMASFERIADPKKREAYLKAFEDAWTKGEGKAQGLTPETFNAIRTDMQQQITRDRVEQEKLVRETGSKVDQLITRLGQGFSVTAEERAAIKGTVEAAADPTLAQNFQFFEALASWQATARLARPETLTASIAAEEARITREGATAQNIDALRAMKELRDTVAEGVEKDMLGLAAKMNLTAVPDLDPANFTGSLIARKATAETVASHYGREPVYFKKGEVEALTRAFAINPDQLVGFAVSLREALGDKTPDALKQLSKDAPVIANVAGVAFATQNDRLLRETAEAMKRKAVEGYKPVKYPEAAKSMAIAEILGPSLSRLPATQAAAIETADMLFDLRVQTAGIDPAKDTEAARAIYETALDDALGREGDAGGVEEVNGTATLLPPGSRGEDVEMALQSLNDADLAQLPAMGTPTGIPVRASDLRNAKLVAIGLGRYWVALGNPRSDDPRYVQSARGGDMWVLELGTLEEITKGRVIRDAQGEPMSEADRQWFFGSPGLTP